MKNKMLLVVGIMVMFVFAVGCNSINKQYQLHIGKYIEKTEGLSWIILEENNQFIFNRHVATSYDPRGTYLVKDNKLILTADSDDNEIYTFIIDENKLILEHDIGNLLSANSVFEQEQE